MKEFRKSASAWSLPERRAHSSSPSSAILAKRLGSYPRVFSHRDYHRENLFIQDGARIRIIDFQDALMAPAAQDLAVMLTTRDSGDIVTPGDRAPHPRFLPHRPDPPRRGLARAP